MYILPKVMHLNIQECIKYGPSIQYGYGVPKYGCVLGSTAGFHPDSKAVERVEHSAESVVCYGSASAELVARTLSFLCTRSRLLVLTIARIDIIV